MSRFEFRAWDGKRMFSPNALVFKGCYIASFTHEEALTAYEVGPGERGEVELQDSSNVIMQCLGVRGEDGEFLWEGDIVEGYGGKAVIEWNDYQEDGACFQPVFFDDPHDSAYEMWSDKRRWHRFTTIGNIHKNPELLEQS